MIEKETFHERLSIISNNGRDFFFLSKQLILSDMIHASLRFTFPHGVGSNYFKHYERYDFHDCWIVCIDGNNYLYSADEYTFFQKKYLTEHLMNADNSIKQKGRI